MRTARPAQLYDRIEARFAGFDFVKGWYNPYLRYEINLLVRTFATADPQQDWRAFDSRLLENIKRKYGLLVRSEHIFVAISQRVCDSSARD